MAIYIAQVTEIYEPVTAVADTPQQAAKLAIAKAHEYLTLRGATDDNGTPWTKTSMTEWFGVTITEVEMNTAWHDQHAGETFNSLAEVK